jgi:hypothetical protein
MGHQQIAQILQNHKSVVIGFEEPVKIILKMSNRKSLSNRVNPIYNVMVVGVFE